MPTLAALKTALHADPAVPLHLMLPTGEFIAAHFHVTEVGRVQKDFLDCGGTRRSSVTCVLQVWVADDVAHRLTSGRLLQILTLADDLFGPNDLPVEVEYDAGVISQYPLTAVESTPGGLLLTLGGKHTDCLAKDRCGVPVSVGMGVEVLACSPGAGCC